MSYKCLIWVLCCGFLLGACQFSIPEEEHVNKVTHLVHDDLPIYEGDIYQGTGLFQFTGYLITSMVRCTDLILEECHTDRTYELWYLVSILDDGYRVYLGHDLILPSLEEITNSGVATGWWVDITATDAREWRLDNPQVAGRGLLSTQGVKHNHVATGVIAGSLSYPNNRCLLSGGADCIDADREPSVVTVTETGALVDGEVVEDIFLVL